MVTKKKLAEALSIISIAVSDHDAVESLVLSGFLLPGLRKLLAYDDYTADDNSLTNSGALAVLAFSAGFFAGRCSIWGKISVCCLQIPLN